MNKERIIGILNKAVEREIGAIFQYMGQHYRFPKDTHPIARELLERIAVEEMKHAEKFSKRVVELGGKESTTTGKVKWETDFIAMLDADIEVEDEAIAMYEEHIKICEEEGDEKTKALYEAILEDEIRHKKLFNLLKEIIKIEG
ncbi:bacterioferritin [Thermosulfidibacter takaii ABI70S6]|uniref:Bacterioferritin n=1 Tax=Thermosulfidibacter takaii (strain DSM 17441 / JCM 13301 / NBRC 103674 / ABI70S6) TaxID=1298851 RepID=A0A0S3QSE4_THET7|nr:ferritin-like domain-containing protein [Thermosulfidibacter takaii]BAT71228.1 bacterioferritin [Thermosulfidibacter takaii ABI70S6]